MRRVVMITATATAAIAQAQPGTDQGDAVSGSDEGSNRDAVLGSGATGSGSAERRTVYVVKPTNAYVDRSAFAEVAFAIRPGAIIYPTEQQGPWTLVENEDGKTGWVATYMLLSGPAPRAAENVDRPTDSLPTSTSTPLPIPSPARCDTGPYLEPSLFKMVGGWTSRPASSTSSVLHRVSAGVLFRRCDNALAAAHVRIGASAYVSNLDETLTTDGVTHFTAGVGLEAEMDFPIQGTIRLGGRVGAETAQNGANLFTLGARLAIVDELWIGLDLFHLSEPSISGAPSCAASSVAGCTATTTGVMLGVIARGRAGAYVAITEAALAGLVLVLASSATTHE